MKIYEIILLLIKGFGGELGGRTLIQKLCYFFSVYKGKNMGFKPHFYGPYSPYVENALDELEGIALVDKEVECLGENSEGEEVKKYNYRLTKYGKQALDTITPSLERQELDEFIGLAKMNEIPSTTDISIAAKSHFILNRENRTLTYDEIRNKAGAFKWKIKPESIDKAIDILKSFNMVK